MNKLRYLAARLREPSTLAGLGVIATLAGLPPGTVDLAAQVLGGLLGLAAIVAPEKAATQAQANG